MKEIKASADFYNHHRQVVVLLAVADEGIHVFHYLFKHLSGRQSSVTARRFDQSLESEKFFLSIHRFDNTVRKEQESVPRLQSNFRFKIFRIIKNAQGEGVSLRLDVLRLPAVSPT